MKLNSKTIDAIREFVERGASSGLDDVWWLRRGVAVVSVLGGRYVLKRPVVPGGPIGRLRRRVIGSISFDHERHVNDQLNRHEYEHFKFPAMVLGSDKFLLFEYVEGEHRSDLEPIQARNLAKGLVEFQFHTHGIRPGMRRRALSLFRPWNGHFRRQRAQRAAEHSGDPELARTAVRVVEEIERSVVPLPRPVLAHGDLNIGNVIFCGSGPYIIDFAAVTMSDRWLWNDIVWFSLPSSKFRIDTELLRAYAAELSELRLCSAEDLVRRLRYSLITRVVFLLCYVDMSACGKMYREFFHDVLVSEAAFRNWIGELLPALR